VRKLAFLLAVLAGPVQAAELYISPTGNDNGNCRTPASACATFDRVIPLMPLTDPNGVSAVVNILHVLGDMGAQQLSLDHLVRIRVVGSGIGTDGVTCTNPALSRVARTWAQNQSVLWHQCITLGQAAAREYSTSVVNDVIFDGSFPIAMVATEQAKLNTTGPVTIAGAITEFADLDNSMFQQVGNIDNNVAGLTVGAFFYGVKGVFRLQYGTYSGHPVQGLRFWTDASDFTFPIVGGALAIPGTSSNGQNTSANSSR